MKKKIDSLLSKYWKVFKMSLVLRVFYKYRSLKGFRNTKASFIKLFYLIVSKSTSLLIFWFG